ncbi:MAG: tetratricopeptide repeat protein, partial [Planctomycetota bacterium]
LEEEKGTAIEQRDELKSTIENQREADQLIATLAYIKPGEKFDQAVMGVLGTAARVSPQYWRVDLELGKHHLRQRRFEEGLKAAKQASRKHREKFGRDSAEIWFHPGIFLGFPTTLGGNGRYEQAMPYLKKAAKAEPDSVFGKLSQVLVVIVGCYISGDTEPSDETVQLVESLVQDPIGRNLGHVWLVRAWIYGASVLVNSPKAFGKYKDMEKAKFSILQYIQGRSTHHVSISNFYGGILFALGEFEAAVFEFTKCIGYKDEAMFRQNRGQALARLRRYDEAIPDLEKAKEKFPNSAILYCYLGMCHRFLGNAEPALEVLNEAVKRFPKLPEAYNQRAWAHYVGGNYDEALGDYKYYYDMQGNPAGADFNLAYMYTRIYSASLKSDPEADVSEYRKAIEFHITRYAGQVDDIVAVVTGVDRRHFEPLFETDWFPKFLETFRKK